MQFYPSKKDYKDFVIKRKMMMKLKKGKKMPLELELVHQLIKESLQVFQMIS